MPEEHVKFIEFVVDDERQRGFLKGQSLLMHSPFEYTDMSLKEAYKSDYEEKARMRIRRSDEITNT